jgi:hypothetical protein
MATSLFRSCLAGSEEASTSEAKAAGKHHQHSNSLKTRPLRSVAGFARYCFTPQGEPSPPTSTSSYNSRSRISSNHSSNHHRSVRGPGAATTDPVRVPLIHHNAPDFHRVRHRRATALRREAIVFGAGTFWAAAARNGHGAGGASCDM